MAWGDASIQTAAKNGGIKTIHHVDYEMVAGLGVLGRFKVLAYGE